MFPNSTVPVLKKEARAGVLRVNDRTFVLLYSICREADD